MFDFILPDIGEGISEALLISWSVEPGQEVNEGDEIATVSTDKVDVELPAPRTGTVSELCWKPGDTVQVGAVFMRIDTGEDSAPVEQPAKRKTPGKETGTTSPRKSMPTNSAGAIVAAPSTRKFASDRGIDLGLVAGSGPDGRIVRADVEAAMTRGGTREPLNGVRAGMFDRMSRSVQTLAHSTINFEVRAEAFMTFIEKHEGKLSPTALLVRCLAGPLAQNPRLNATIDESRRELILHDSIDISVAMATDRGLVVPVLKEVEISSLDDISGALAEIVARAREGKLTHADMAGGTFTLSNTGALEKTAIVSTRPVVNMPQTAILWVSRVRARPVVDNDKVVPGQVMNASLSFDHRFLDGADAVNFINDFASAIENPDGAAADNKGQKQ